MGEWRWFIQSHTRENAKLYLEALNLILHSISMLNSLKLKSILDRYLPPISSQDPQDILQLLECLRTTSRVTRNKLQQFQKQFCNIPTWLKKNNGVTDV